MDKERPVADNVPAPRREMIRLQHQPSTSGREAPPVRVLLLSDGRPGHYRQSEGVVAALRRRGPVVLDRVALAARLPLPKAAIPKLARRLPAMWLLRGIHGLDPATLVRPDLIVSAGGATLGANVALARLWGVPNVFSGSTRGFPLSAFRLVLTPYASAATAGNVVAGPKPTPFDPDAVPTPRPIRGAEDLRGARLSLLVGGPTASAAFVDADWARIADLVAALVAAWSCEVRIVTSPRTPEAALARLLPLAAVAPDRISVIDYRTAGAGSIERAFDCELILVTSDSMSMMTEAALSRRPAIALAPEIVRPHRDDEAVATLAAAGWIAVVPAARATPDALARAAGALTPIGANHLDLLATLVAKAAFTDEPR